MRLAIVSGLGSVASRRVTWPTGRVSHGIEYIEFIINHAGAAI